MLQLKRVLWCRHIEGILPKGPYLPCVSVAGRALLAGYPRIIGSHCSITNHRTNSWFVPSQWETALLCNGIFHWLGENLESALNYDIILQATMWLLCFKLTPILPSHEDKLWDLSCLYFGENLRWIWQQQLQKFLQPKSWNRPNCIYIYRCYNKKDLCNSVLLCCSIGEWYSNIIFSYQTSKSYQNSSWIGRESLVFILDAIEL